ncbi:hypothetical protein Cgig2_030782 [Carnegiea gigantea]|uniref:DUF4283 domain-containing protein n=1 Tax=Carnegiea gigantea TaxID=171969 RepID=A0A9Q1KU80_9CARY|nr:hypothetical protein Cgig2_030782 [Carnegiea gigantea]
MADDLAEKWKRLNHTEVEDDVNEYQPDQGDEVQAQVSLCLVGKLYTSNSFNPEALKQTIRNIWRPSHGLVITDLDHNLFAFQFFSASDRDYICDLLMSIHNLKFTEIMGNKIDWFIEVDETDILVPSKALKIKADCDLKKPLRQGLMVKMNGTPSWFKMKYVKLLDFCYACGLLGHVY